MEKKEIEEKIKNLYYELNSHKNERDQIVKELGSIDEKIKNIDMNVDFFKELKDVKENNEILIPFLQGIFLKGKITDNKEFIVNVGNNVTIKKTNDEVLLLLKNQKNKLENFKVLIERELNRRDKIIFELEDKSFEILNQFNEVNKN